MRLPYQWIPSSPLITNVRGIAPTYEGIILYSVETYAYDVDKYFAHTSDYIKCRLGVSDDKIRMLKPVSEGPTRHLAITGLAISVHSLTGVDPGNQYYINIRHHDEYGCYRCSSLDNIPKFDVLEEWQKHMDELHTRIAYAFGVPLSNGF